MYYISRINADEYEAFVKGYPNLMFMSSSLWGEFKARANWDMEIVGMKEDSSNELCAAAVLLSHKIPAFKKQLYYSPRGYIIDWDNNELVQAFTELLKDYLKPKAFVYKFDPYIEYQYRDINGDAIGEPAGKRIIDNLSSLGYKNTGLYYNNKDKDTVSPRWLSAIDIDNRSIDEIFNSMRTMTKRKIKKAQKYGLEVREIRDGEVTLIKDVLQHTADRQGFADRSLEYYEMMYETMSKDNIISMKIAEVDFNKIISQLEQSIADNNNRLSKLAVNEKNEGKIKELQKSIDSQTKDLQVAKDNRTKYGNKAPASVGIFLSYGDQVVYLYGGGYQDLMNYEGQYLIQYEMISEAVQNGYNIYNFYGIDYGFTPDYESYGLFDFKRGFGARVVELVGEFDLVLDGFIYRSYRFMLNTYQRLR